MARYQGPIEQAHNYARLGKPNPYVEMAWKLDEMEARRLRDAALASAREGLASPRQRRFGDALSITGLALAAAGASRIIVQDDDPALGIVIAVHCLALIPVALWSKTAHDRAHRHQPLADRRAHSGLGHARRIVGPGIDAEPVPHETVPRRPRARPAKRRDWASRDPQVPGRPAGHSVRQPH
jgi:hypothetical protein